MSLTFTFTRRWFGPDEMKLSDGREYRIDGDMSVFRWPSCEWAGVEESREVIGMLELAKDSEQAASRRKRWGAPR